MVRTLLHSRDSILDVGKYTHMRPSVDSSRGCERVIRFVAVGSCSWEVRVVSKVGDCAAAGDEARSQRTRSQE
jgi:hypothetical protein